MHWYGWIIAITAGLAALFYLGVPLLVKATLWQAAELELTPTRVEDLSELGRDGVARMVRELGAEGFIVVSNHHLPQSAANVTAVQILFVNPTAGDMAVGIYSSSGSEPRQQLWTISLRTYFADAAEIETASSAGGSVFPPDPASDVINAWWLRDARLLYAIHRARVQRSSRAGEDRVVPEPGAEVEFQKGEWRRDFRRLTAAGYFWLDQAANRHRMTFKGAYLMTWRALWPLKQMRLASRRRKAMRVIRDLGFVVEGPGGL